MDWIAQWPSQLILGASIFMGAVSRWLLVDRHGAVIGFLRSLSAAIFLSFVLYYGLGELDVAPGFRLAIVAAAAFVAEDILLALRSAVQALKDDPAEFLVRIVKAVFKKGE